MSLLKNLFWTILRTLLKTLLRTPLRTLLTTLLTLLTTPLKRPLSTLMKKLFWTLLRSLLKTLLRTPLRTLLTTLSTSLLQCSIQDLILVRRKTHSFYMSAFFFLRVCASCVSCPISVKHPLIYSAYIEGNENASAEGASEKNTHNGLVHLKIYINIVLFIQVKRRTFARKKNGLS